jgi:Calmodulin-binding
MHFWGKEDAKNIEEKVLRSEKMNKVPQKKIGKIPRYLQSIERDISKAAELRRQEAEKQRLYRGSKFNRLETPELFALKQSLKARWNELTKILSQISHKRFFNSDAEVKRREQLDQQLEYIEKCMARLDQKTVFVDLENKFPSVC